MSQVKLTILSELIARVLGFLSSIILARYLGIEDFGRWNYIQAILLYLVVLTEFGSNQEGVRRLVSSRNNDINEFESSFKHTAGTKQTGGIVSCIAILSFFISGLITAYETLALSVCVASYLLSKDWLLRSTGKQFIATLHNTVPLAFVLLSAATLASLGKRLEASSTDFFLLRAIALFFTILLITIKFVPRQTALALAPPRYMIPSKGLIYLVAGSLLAKAYFNADILLIQHYLGSREVGLYSAIATIYAAFIAFRGVIINAIYPSLCSTTDDKELREKVHRHSILFGTLLLPAFIFSYFFRSQLISLVFGHDFLTPETSEISAIFIITCIALSFGLLYPNALHVKGRSKEFFFLTLAASLINISGNILFIPTTGIIAAAYTTLLAEALITLASLSLFIYRTRPPKND